MRTKMRMKMIKICTSFLKILLRKRVSLYPIPIRGEVDSTFASFYNHLVKKAYIPL